MSDQERQPDPRSGVAADGTWTPAFEGQRPPLRPGHEHRVQAGNDLAVTHGAYAVLQLTPRAGELAEKLRGLADHLTAADEPALETLALLLAQLERAAGVLDDVDEVVKRGADVDLYLGRVERRSRLSADTRGWAKEARNLLHELGLTPKGRRDLEERTLTVFHQHEVHAAIAVWFEIASRYVDRGRFDAFADEVQAAFERLDSGVRELPAADVVEGRVSSVEDGSSEET